MKITNPTNTDIKVQIFGVAYELDGDGTLENVSQEAAAYWLGLQGFLIVEEDDAKEKAKTPVVKKEKTADAIAKVLEVAKEEPKKKETPKTATKKTNKK